MKINKKWHAKNKMPENAAMGQRTKWHISHQENCNCRPIPDKVVEYIRKNKILSKTKTKPKQNLNA
jgi:hypothetical protein